MAARWYSSSTHTLGNTAERYIQQGTQHVLAPMRCSRNEALRWIVLILFVILTCTVTRCQCGNGFKRMGDAQSDQTLICNP